MVECEKCKTNLNLGEYCPKCGTYAVDNMNGLQYLVALLIPLIAMIAGIYYNHKGKIWRKNSIYISIGAWILWIIIGIIF